MSKFKQIKIQNTTEKINLANFSTSEITIIFEHHWLSYLTIPVGNATICLCNIKKTNLLNSKGYWNNSDGLNFRIDNYNEDINLTYQKIKVNIPHQEQFIILNPLSLPTLYKYSTLSIIDKNNVPIHLLRDFIPPKILSLQLMHINPIGSRKLWNFIPSCTCKNT